MLLWAVPRADRAAAGHPARGDPDRAAVVLLLPLAVGFAGLAAVVAAIAVAVAVVVAATLLAPSRREAGA